MSAIHESRLPTSNPFGMQDQSRLYIGLLWSSRRQERIRAIIRGHIRMIRKWASQS